MALSLSSSYDHSEKGFFHKLGKITADVGVRVAGVIAGWGLGTLAVNALGAVVTGSVAPIIDLGIKAASAVGGYMFGKRVVDHQYSH